MTLGDLYAVFGMVDVLRLPARGGEVGARGVGVPGGDGRDPRLLAARRGSLRREIKRCPNCRAGALPAFATQPAVAVLGSRLSRWGRWLGIEDRAVVSQLPLEACPLHRGWMLDVVGTEFVVLDGPGAMGLWRADADRGFEGRVGIWEGRWVVMPVINPKRCGEALTMWRALVAGELSVGECLAVTCVRCGDRVNHYDADGVAWCRLHHERKRAR